MKAGIGQKCRYSMGGGGWLWIWVKKDGGAQERERAGETGMSAERPLWLMPFTGAQNYLQLNDPIHSLDAIPPLAWQHKNPD